jgi:hypothetical protein
VDDHRFSSISVGENKVKQCSEHNLIDKHATASFSIRLQTTPQPQRLRVNSIIMKKRLILTVIAANGDAFGCNAK